MQKKRMSDTCPVSNKVIEFLLASPEERMLSQSAFEMFHSSVDQSQSTLIAAVVITRCLDGSANFLIGNLSSFDVSEDGKYRYEVRPVAGFIDFLGFKRGELPVFDEVHIGPFDANAAMKALELAHARYRMIIEGDKASALRQYFQKGAKSDMGTIVHQSDVGAKIIRPLRWRGLGPE